VATEKNTLLLSLFIHGLKAGATQEDTLLHSFYFVHGLKAGATEKNDVGTTSQRPFM